ncbi:hypothetical protein GF406_23480 [candidate division KSB1 bacterium]|nr:hypothetical protein [candidate division KSB1 bacterium]
MDIVLLVMGWIITLFISWLIAQRIAVHLDKLWASFTYLFVALLAFYYLIDLALDKEIKARWLYFLFWLLLMIIELILFIRARQKANP